MLLEHGMNVLIVDDEKLLLWSLKRLFNKNQIDVQTVQSGEEALVQLKQRHFDWLVSDMRLPGISGLEVLRFAKNNQPHIHTIVISAFGSGSLRRQLSEIGIDLYLDKPFDLDVLLQFIKTFKVEPPAETPPVKKKSIEKMFSFL